MKLVVYKCVEGEREREKDWKREEMWGRHRKTDCDRGKTER